MKVTRLGCHRLPSNEVRLMLGVIGYNLGNQWRRLVLPRRIANWSLTSLQQRFIKRPAGEARAMLLAAAGGERTDTAAVRWAGSPPCR